MYPPNGFFLYQIVCLNVLDNFQAKYKTDADGPIMLQYWKSISVPSTSVHQSPDPNDLHFLTENEYEYVNFSLLYSLQEWSESRLEGK